jgi:hypothetical protein
MARIDVIVAPPNSKVDTKGLASPPVVAPDTARVITVAP